MQKVCPHVSVTGLTRVPQQMAHPSSRRRMRFCTSRTYDGLEQKHSPASILCSMVPSTPASIEESELLLDGALVVILADNYYSGADSWATACVTYCFKGWSNLQDFCGLFGWQLAHSSFERRNFPN